MFLWQILDPNKLFFLIKKKKNLAVPQVLPQTLWDLSSLTKDWTWALGSENADS